MRGRSYSPSPPPRGYGRRGRSPSPRGRYAGGGGGGGRSRDNAGGGGSRDDPTTLLVRNLRHDCRPEDLKKPFGQFGPVKDIYLPRDYYTRSETTKSFQDFNQVVRVLLAISSSKRTLDTIQVIRVQGDVNQSKEFKGSEDWEEYGYQ